MIAIICFVLNTHRAIPMRLPCMSMSPGVMKQTQYEVCLVYMNEMEWEHQSEMPVCACTWIDIYVGWTRCQLAITKKKTRVTPAYVKWMCQSDEKETVILGWTFCFLWWMSGHMKIGENSELPNRIMSLLKCKRMKNYIIRVPLKNVRWMWWI